MSTPSDTPEIRPALTAEEWEDVARVLTERRDAADNAADYHGSQGAAVAASRLTNVIHSIEDGTPFGLRWEDVGVLRESAADPEMWSGRDKDADLRSLADRIAALLPPREESEAAQDTTEHRKDRKNQR